MALDATVSIDSARKALSTYFGYDSFRPQQAEIISSIYNGHDVLVLMPTGGGKSLCFQIPAATLPGCALVVSPLISLMKDQVEALQANGIPANFLNSSQTMAEQAQVENDALAGRLKLLYVSPEKLASQSFLPLLQNLKPSLIAIDEAHCISSWGHDFRPEYTQLKFLKRLFPQTPLVACTATADKVTRDDIKIQLGVPEAETFLASFDRPNLSLEVRPGTKKLPQIIEYLVPRRDQSGIIYCISRKATEQLAMSLRKKGFKADFYHAGMEPSERSKVQEDFINDRINIVCATIAFGMGIDKSNVRFVIHHNLPASLENYYQEIGRAGRDGAPSDTLLFYSMQDVSTYHYLWDSEESSIQEMKYTKLDRMMNYAQAMICRRKILLNYFSETLIENCGHCDICKNPPKFIDGTVLAQKALSAVARSQQQLGTTMLIDVLRGSKRREIIELGFDKIKTFGAGGDLSIFDWKFIIQQFIQLGLLEIDYTRKNKLSISEAGKAVLFGKKKIEIARSGDFAKTLPKAKESRGKKEPVKVDRKDQLFQRLRAIRTTLAKKANVPPYIIFSDASLYEMAREKPLTEQAFFNISGVGQKKLEKYGTWFLEGIASFLASQSRNTPTVVSTQARPMSSSERLESQEAKAIYKYSEAEILNLHREGYSVKEIAKQAKIDEGIIGQYLLKAYIHGKSMDFWSIVPKEDYENIREKIAKAPEESTLNWVYKELDAKYTFTQLKFCMANMAKAEDRVVE